MTPAVSIRLLQHADADAVLEAALRSPSTDPYAHIVWPAALAAARALARIVEPGQVVLDVGAGTGLCALVAAALGAQAIAIDRDADSLERIVRASAMNGVNVKVVVCDVEHDRLPACDIAVFADVLYEIDLARVMAVRAAEVIESGATVIIADPGRAARAELDLILEARGIAVAYEDMGVQLPSDEPAVVQVAVIRGRR